MRGIIIGAICLIGPMSAYAANQRMEIGRLETEIGNRKAVLVAFSDHDPECLTDTHVVSVESVRLARAIAQKAGELKELKEQAKALKQAERKTQQLEKARAKVKQLEGMLSTPAVNPGAAR